MNYNVQQRRRQHPEVDWRQPITFMTESDRVIHPRSTGKNYANQQEPKRCICGARAVEHDSWTGEYAKTGCDMLYIERSESIR